MATEKIIKKLYKDEIEIIFYPNAHRYKLQGEKGYLLSSTAITGVIDKSRVLIPWAIGCMKRHLLQHFENSNAIQFTKEELFPIIDEASENYNVVKQEACDVGSLVHGFAESFAIAKINGTELPSVGEDLPEQVLNGINAFIDWFNENNVEFLEIEKFVYSKEHNFVGTFDLLARVNGELVLIDFKTSKGIYNEHVYQLTGYKIAHNEEMKAVGGEEVEKLMVLHFNKETGDFKDVFLDTAEYEKNKETFLALLTVKNREKELLKVRY